MEEVNRENDEGEENVTEGMMTTGLEARLGQLNLADIVNQRSRSIEDFEELDLINQGAYSIVYKARDKGTGEIVALKKFRMDTTTEVIRKTAEREIESLWSLQHENVIKLKWIVTSNLLQVTVGLVLEYMDHDLADLIMQDPSRLSDLQIKCYMKQLLTGLHYCHSNKVLHRDLKPENLLVNNEGILKLADFGLARLYSDKDMTNDVISGWYKPPELLLGSTRYTEAVDMWSVGCIFAELFYGAIVFKGENECDQLEKIRLLCGSYDESNWPGVSQLPRYVPVAFGELQKATLKVEFQSFHADVLQLVERMLTLDPSRRITAQEALQADYFKTEMSCDPSTRPHDESSNVFEITKQIQEKEEDKSPSKSQQLHGSGARGGLKGGGPHRQSISRRRNTVVDYFRAQSQSSGASHQLQLRLEIFSYLNSIQQSSSSS